MGLTNPYYRIIRPKADPIDYVVDKRYAKERWQLSRAYINIERDLRKIFDFIEPDEVNKDVFSFELYSLLLRACTEVELNCKLILMANGAKPIKKHFTMEDYKKLELSSLLSKYTATFNNWRRRNKATQQLEYIDIVFQPFASFSRSIAKAPDWYEAYNAVKHNREENLEKASLENCMNAVAGVLILLYSQFGSQCIETYNEAGKLYFCEDDSYDNLLTADVIFTIKAPKESDWPSNEIYDFDWKNIKGSNEPFKKFPF